MTVDAIERAVDKIARLSAQPRDLVSLWQEATEVVKSVVPYDHEPCWYTVDPGSLLITSHFHFGMPTFPPDWLASEYYEDDVNKIADIARSANGVSTLHEATNGDPSGSPRWLRNIELGGDQELIGRFRTRSGAVWGAMGIYRMPGRPMFSEQDKAVVAAVAPHLAEGARRALLVGQASEPDFADSPGLLILDDAWDIESATPGTERWLGELPDGDAAAGTLPAAVLAVAGRALRLASNPNQPGEVAVSRVQSHSGNWVVLHGACLNSSAGARRIAVIIEPAQPSRLYPLLMSAYGLTDREKDVTRLVLQGNSTSQIAAELVVSANTVQQHLKSIFDKTGVRSRRDLVGKVFYTHYEPRFRDNEQRVAAAKPVRGEPWGS